MFLAFIFDDRVNKGLELRPNLKNLSRSLNLRRGLKMVGLKMVGLKMVGLKMVGLI